MTEIKTDYIIYFKRDDKVDYEKGNTFINTIFKKYDTNMSGDFDDTEWANYQKDLGKHHARLESAININNGVVAHYDKKISKIAQKIENLYKKYSKYTKSDAFDKLLEFEKAHPAVTRNGYKNSSEVPTGATIT